MPPLDHYPNRQAQGGFDYRDSQVMAYLTTNPDVLHWIFNHVKEQGLIRFDPATNRWEGVRE